MSRNASTGVLVMAYGGPNTLDEVESYLMDVRGGRPTARPVIDEVIARYRQIGGRSPILERTRDQAEALQAALDRLAGQGRYQTFTGMRHWHPYIREALEQMVGCGIHQAIGLVMAPHYSRMSIGAYFQKTFQNLEGLNSLHITPIERWHLLPGYLDALDDRVRSALMRFPEDVRAQVSVLFTAHSLPQRILEWEDPYPEELQETVAALSARLSPQPYGFAYQSAAMTTEPWLGPDAGQVLDQWARGGRKHVLIAPIGFVTEHVEILYDVDIVYRQQAQALGMQLERIEMLNTHPAMINGLAGLVHQCK